MVKEKIDVILQNRKSKREGIKNKLDIVNKLSLITKDLDNKELQKSISDAKSKLQEIYNKFRKDSLNILVTGQARQGKSTFLQTVTGLSDTHIPTSDGKDLTASKSIIVNSLENKAVVRYLNEEEFLENINEYYRELGLEEVKTLDEFESDSRLENLDLKGTLKEYLNHLLFLKNHLNEYRYKIGSEEEEEIDIDDVRKYIAYEDENGNRNLSWFAAVKEVVVYTKFPNEEVGKIAFIDLPGINDVKKGLLERVSKEVKENVDAVFIIKKPAGEGDKFDNNDHMLYDILAENLGDKVSEVTYVIINKTPSNEKQCNILYEDLKSSNASLKIKEGFIVNVKNKAEVDMTMIKVLEEIADYLEKEDKKDLEKIDEFFKELLKEIEKVEYLLDDEIDVSEEAEEFVLNLEEKFKDIIKINKEKNIFGKIFKKTLIDSIENKRNEEYLNSKKEKLISNLKRRDEYNIDREAEKFARSLANDIVLNIIENVNDELNKKVEEVKLLVSKAIAEAGFNASEKEALEKFVNVLTSKKVEKIRNLFEKFLEFRFDLEMLLEAEVANVFEKFIELIKDKKTIKNFQGDMELLAAQIVMYDLDDVLVQLKRDLIEKYQELPDKIMSAVMFKTLKAYNIDENMQKQLQRFMEKNYHFLSVKGNIDKQIEKKKSLESIKELIKGVMND